MTPDEWRTVGEAIVIWTGWGSAMSPSRNDQALADQLGREAADKLLPIVRELEADFYTSDARHTAADLVEMAMISSQQFATKHPELPANAVRALAWCYTFDYK